MTHHRRTALLHVHEALGATFTDFGGWQMPLKYGSELAEHRAVRTAAGLFDLSHMGQVRLTGPRAGEALDHALVGRFSAMRVGRAKYTVMVEEDGGILDDLIVYRLGEQEYLAVPNAGNTPVVAAELTTRAAGLDTHVTDESAQIALIAVQGPRAEAIVSRLVAPEARESVAALRYYACEPMTVARTEVLIARTGYTGEDGFELFVPNSHATGLWQALRDAGEGDGLIPAGLAARDSLRLEAGMPLYGHELTTGVTPVEAGLTRMIPMDPPVAFVGRPAVERRLATGPSRVLAGLVSRQRRAARAGAPVLSGGRVVGEVTSGQPSPTLGHPIALAHLDPALAEPGTTVEVEIRGTPLEFEVSTLPFYRRPGR